MCSVRSLAQKCVSCSEVAKLHVKPAKPAGCGEMPAVIAVARALCGQCCRARAPCTFSPWHFPLLEHGLPSVSLFWISARLSPRNRSCYDIAQGSARAQPQGGSMHLARPRGSGVWITDEESLTRMKPPSARSQMHEPTHKMACVQDRLCGIGGPCARSSPRRRQRTLQKEPDAQHQWPTVPCLRVNGP